MPVLPTTNLQMVKPASESDAEKVARYNQLVDEIDAVLAGMLTLSVAGGTNVTLTRVQAMNRLLKFTGVLTASISVFIDPTLGSARLFTVWNATTGAFDLTVKTTVGGSTGIAVSQGAKAELFHDGTNVDYAGAEV